VATVRRSSDVEYIALIPGGALTDKLPTKLLKGHTVVLRNPIVDRYEGYPNVICHTASALKGTGLQEYILDR